MQRIRATRSVASTVTAVTLGIVLLSLARGAAAADTFAQTRALGSFDRIRLGGAFTTEIVAGEKRSQIVISGERDVVERVTTEVRGGTLEVGMRDGSMNHESPKLVITLPALRGINNSGAGTVKITGLHGGDVAIANAGAASITAAGRASDLQIALDGAGKIDTTAVSARDVTVNNNGVGAVYVRASGSLTMNVNGIGEIRYAGNPSHVESHVNGIGRIGKM